LTSAFLVTACAKQKTEQMVSVSSYELTGDTTSIYQITQKDVPIEVQKAADRARYAFDISQHKLPTSADLDSLAKDVAKVLSQSGTNISAT
ncbi:hypothetical protein ABK046_46405, partial [Streptomyces caeruleatus]